MTELRAGLPPLPLRLASLPIDERGYPVPFFVAWVDGKPDHRVMDGEKLRRALNHGLCWMCGDRLGVHKAFALGPMCAITRTVSEPPSHLECLHYAMRVCPFMTRPRAQRREANLPDDVTSAGLPITRNPGVTALWVTRSFATFRANVGGPGVLFSLGDPEVIEWWAEGRRATRDEILASVSGGFPLLEEQAQLEPGGASRVAEAQRALGRRHSEFMSLLDLFAPEAVAAP